MSERSYIQRMLSKALTSNEFIEHVEKTKKPLQATDYLMSQLIRDCVNDLDKRLSAIEKQLTIK